jgi:hypothetical protein
MTKRVTKMRATIVALLALVAAFGAQAGKANVRLGGAGVPSAGYAAASDAAIASAGLPPRPRAAPSSERYQTWLRVVGAAHTPLDVDFVPAPQAPATPARVIQPDWAGAVLFAPGAQPLRIPRDRFSTVEGEWIVPHAKPTINCSNPHEQTDGSSLWIALDGWMSTFIAHQRRKNGSWHRYQSTDILQAGSESDVRCYRGAAHPYATHAFFWIEWAGRRNIAVAPGERTLPLKAGDTIYVKIAAQTTGPDAWQRATLWLVDETTGYYLPARTFHSGCVDCGTPFQRPATLFGDTAEWITEATFYSSDNPAWPNTLDDFGSVVLTSAFATDQYGTTYSPGAPGAASPNIDWMTWNGVPLGEHGTLLASSRVVAPAAVRFTRAPYAIASPGQQGDLEPKPRSCRPGDDEI